MEGVQYIVNERGQRKAVIIDLDVFGGLWEDVHDLIVVESRKAEPRSKWKDVKRRLKINSQD